MTFVFSRRISELEAKNIDFTLRLAANEDFQATEKNRVQEIIDMVSENYIGCKTFWPKYPSNKIMTDFRAILLLTASLILLVKVKIRLFNRNTE